MSLEHLVLLEVMLRNMRGACEKERSYLMYRDGKGILDRTNGIFGT